MKVLMNCRMECRRIELVECIVDHAEDTLKKAGLSPDESIRIATSVADNLIDVFGGQNLTFPSKYKKKLAEKEALIFQQFNGTNGAELAKVHGMTERGLRKLLDRARGRTAKGVAV